MFEKFFHEVTGPYIWGLILLLSLRAIFSSVRKKDYPHAAAFIVVAIAAAFMTASALDMLPPAIAEIHKKKAAAQRPFYKQKRRFTRRFFVLIFS